MSTSVTNNNKCDSGKGHSPTCHPPNHRHPKEVREKYWTNEYRKLRDRGNLLLREKWFNLEHDWVHNISTNEIVFHRHMPGETGKFWTMTQEHEACVDDFIVIINNPSYGAIFLRLSGTCSSEAIERAFAQICFYSTDLFWSPRPNSPKRTIYWFRPLDLGKDRFLYGGNAEHRLKLIEKLLNQWLKHDNQCNIVIENVVLKEGGFGRESLTFNLICKVNGVFLVVYDALGQMNFTPR